ncbi:UDP-N-acetylmuramate--L-alanine ligase [Urechidicola sp. KH5]
MKLKDIHSIYFIGIGGIGMSALARYFNAQGFKVAGYDKVASDITRSLVEEGIKIWYDMSSDFIPNEFRNREETLVVYTPAVPNSHEVLQFFKSEEFRVLKRSEMLGLITKDTFCLAVAGTHGKTTTSTILGHILEYSGVGATSFLGGISENYHSNLILGNEPVSVVEADEFDRSFLRLDPNIACITSIDADHLDIYGESSELEQSFKDFGAKVTDILFVRKGLPIEGVTFAVEEKADYYADNITVKDGVYVFDIITPKEIITDVNFYLPGKHNVLNAVAALAMANTYGVPLQVIAEALRSFKGVERRFSYKIKRDDLVLIDDYAHHPTEIDAVANAVSEMYSEKRTLAVFQPHLYSRTRDFVDDFARSLAQFDEIILLDVYPARELPIPNVNSKWLLDKIKHPKKKLSSKEELLINIQQCDAQVVVVMGAGDIGLLVENIQISLQ